MPGSPDGANESSHPDEDGRGALATVATPAGADDAATLLRFSGATRALHWVNALPFICLLVSGLLLYVPEIKAVHLGGHRLVALLHVLVGAGFIGAVPLTVALVRNRRALVRDVEQALTPEPSDFGWLRYAVLTVLGASASGGPEPPSGKFNAGQKLNTLFWVCITAGLVASGAVLGVNYVSKRFLDAAFVERVFPWHTALALLSIPALLGHLYLALLNPGTRPALRGILSGHVRAGWARRHHARWAAEVSPSSTPSPSTDGGARGE
jgi:formate dehydrogenase subunit gamma